MEIKEELTKSKLKLLEKVNEKLDSENLTTEDMKNISATLSSIISFADYADKLCGGFNSFGAQRVEKTDKNKLKGD